MQRAATGELHLSSKATAIFNAQTVALRTQLNPYPVTEEAGMGRGRGNELPEKDFRTT